MHDSQLLRYSRHIMLDELGIEGQDKLLASHALIIGAGGLGSPAALYLGSAGVGRVTVVDHDRVDATNLQRQIAHKTTSVGGYKAQSIGDAIAAINPDVQVETITTRADDALLHQWVPQANVVLDCTDNFATRHAINRACVVHRKPLVLGAAIRFDGQLAVFDARQANAPCYSCLFPESQALEEAQCATMGVFAPLVGIIGSMQAAEAIKLLCGAGESVTGRLLMLDGKTMRWTEIGMAQSLDCPVCTAQA